MTVVSDSSPLIGLSTINSLELLHELFGAIDIPQAVYEEVVVKGAGRPGAQEIASATWITRRAVIDQQAVTKFKNKTALQQGESEAIVLALELSAALIILDDRSARQRAREVKLPVIGTLGVLLLAKDRHLLTSVKGSMDALRAAGWRVSPMLYEAVLRTAGEL